MPLCGQPFLIGFPAKGAKKGKLGLVDIRILWTGRIWLFQGKTFPGTTWAAFAQKIGVRGGEILRLGSFKE